MEIVSLEQVRDLSALSRAIFQADMSENLIRELPPQTLYQVIRHNGLESSVELIESISTEQLRSLLDFDLRTSNSFEETKLWDWLELNSEEDDLIVLQKIINSLDLKLVALLIAKYLEVRTSEEKTDTAPGPLFFTPDQGFTWIRVLCEDQRKHFLMSKMLAFLFESNADVFYQLLASKAVTTSSILEEEAYLDRTKRLAAEGFPEAELAGEITAFMSVKEALDKLSEHEILFKQPDIVVVESLIQFSDSLEPLTSALQQQSNLEERLSEMTLIINAALVRFKVSLSDSQGISFIASQCQGACNIGLQILSSRSSIDTKQIVEKVGLQIPFRVGLSNVLDVAKAAKKWKDKLETDNIEISPASKALLDLLFQPFPALPASLSRQKSDFVVDYKEVTSEQDHLSARPQPFRYLEEITDLKAQFL